ncbi:MAG: hypothetical protein ISR48_02590 [Alphaproteobacteria bacterium]|nr:hypothetical protein [Alphaproteobacteria bacterium]
MTEFDRLENLPVIPVGHAGTKTFFYFVRSTRQIVALTWRSHTQNQFLAMAEEADWLHYGRIRLIHGSIDWSALAESLMAHCREEGIYDPSLTRGRGAWRDDNSIIYHAGDTLYVNGKRTQFEAFTKTKYRYLGALKTTHPAQDAATIGDCEELLSFIETWGWEWPVLAPKIILGWIGCALICGALKWRPHLWITGTKGSGKSTLDGLIASILGDLAVHVQGSTTEPGLRQVLNGDARPVLFDEFEAENSNAKAVIDAARSAASDNAAPVVKGTPEGKPIFYKLRFAAMFSGIIANVQRDADKSRMVILEMHPLRRDENQRRRLIIGLDRFANDFGPRLLRRMLDSLTNGKFDDALLTLLTAIRLEGGDERKADVFAHLLAANHVLIRDDVLTENEARAQAALITELDVDEPSDEEACLSHLIGHRVTVDYGYTRTLGEWLINIHEDKPSGPTADAVRMELERHGVKTEGNTIKVANATLGIKAIYAGTRWANGSHWRILHRLPRARAGGNARFAGDQSKCTVIPWNTMMPVEE